MLRSQGKRNQRASSGKLARWKRILAASLCAAGWLSGPLYGQQPQGSPRPQSQAQSPWAWLTGDKADHKSKPAAKKPADKTTASPFRPASTLLGGGGNQLKPTLVQPAEAISPAGDDGLAPVVTAAEMRARKTIQPAAGELPFTPPAPAEVAPPAGEAKRPGPVSPWMQDIRDVLTSPASAPQAKPLAPFSGDQQELAPIVNAPGREESKPAASKPVEPSPPAPVSNPFASAPLGATPFAPAPLAPPSKPANPVEISPEVDAPAASLGAPSAAPVAPAPVAEAPPQNTAPSLSPFTAPPVAPAPVIPAPAPAPLSTAPLNLAPTFPTKLQEPERLAPTAPTAPAGQTDALRAANSPFEVIDETGLVQVTVRRSRLLRTKTDIYRTAVVDDSVCDVVQFTPREVSIIGKGQGATHVTFWFDDKNMAPVTYLIKVLPDIEEIKKQEDNYKMLEDVINEMFPDSKIHLVLVADKLIVKGQAKDSEEAAQILALLRSQGGSGGGQGGFGGYGIGLAGGAAAQVLSDSATGTSSRSRFQVINMLRVPGVQQVALRVKIAELNRSAARGFGVDIAGNINLTNNPDGSQIFLSSLLNAAGGAGPALITQFDGDDIQLGVRYLQQHGVIRLLSEPTLVTMSGTPATFIAGGEFAVPTVVGGAGLNAVTTDFRAFGAIISFMPTVVDKDRVRLQVSPEFSQINNNLAVGGTPGLRTRAATTTVEMREGQTLAIAGLLEDNMNGTNVGDLPFLARIFGRRDMSHTETELIILVTPELVHPMEAEEVPPLPGFDVTEPTNAEFFLHGSLEGNPTRDYRSTVWPRLKKRYGAGGPAMTSGPFGHGQ